MPKAYAAITTTGRRVAGFDVPAGDGAEADALRNLIRRMKRVAGYGVATDDDTGDNGRDGKSGGSRTHAD